MHSEPTRQGLFARLWARFGNPYRTMYGSGHGAGVNPAMAAAAQRAPEVIAHESLGRDDGARSFGGAGVFGVEKPQSERSSTS